MLIYLFSKSAENGYINRIFKGRKNKDGEEVGRKGFIDADL